MDQIFSAIFNYINYLINHIRPKKRIYIAIDGVAPRAKMNNQRQRRYHSAKANRSLNEFLTGDLHTSPGVVSFKNNSISPGTEFMMDLIDKIKLFIKRKIFEDDCWKHLEVFMSGGDVPGEGEHKIMDWLRGWKQSKDYDINESHCIYSNDADLIFLSLSLHLPKIVILREVQKYDDKHVNAATKRHSEEQGIELLFINLLREYLELEYKVDQHRYKKQAFDIERIIDDFILIAFFIGNDFLHQLYCMSTKKGNFDEIIDVFKRVLPGIGGYLSDKGHINWSNFLVFLKQITYLENKMIKTTLDQMIDHLRDVEKNQSNFINMSDSTTIDDSTTENQTTEDMNDDDEEEADRRRNNRDDDDDEDLEHEAFDETEAQKFEDTTIQHTETADADQNKQAPTKGYLNEHRFTYNKIKNEVSFISSLLKVFESKNPEEIEKKKQQFYSKFFGLRELEQRKAVCLDYAKGLQFVMHYYFHGCPSWTWYYPYFMSPFLSDLIAVLDENLQEVDLHFNLDQPYRPFDQLAYILPRASLNLLPDIYKRVLLSNPKSEKYYPENLDEFEPFDAIHSYQWIAKLELFNDLDMADVLMLIDDSNMTEEEKRRNRNSHEELYRFDEKAEPLLVKSLISCLPDFEVSLSIKPFDRAAIYPFREDRISYDLTGLDTRDGFPSLNIIPGIRGALQDISRKAKYRRLILEIEPDASNPNRDRNHIRGFVFYDYPFKKIGHINTIIDENGSQNIGNTGSQSFEDIVYSTRATGAYNVYKAVQGDSTYELFKEKGIDYRFKGTREPFYEIEYRKSAWRTVMSTKGEKIIYDFASVKEIYPHGLLIPFDRETAQLQQTQFRFPMTETELYQKDGLLVSLDNGDLLRIKQVADDFSVLADVVKPNCHSIKDLTEPRSLIEDHWEKIDKHLLRDIGLAEDQVDILFALMDSFVIKTDSSQPSSLILGEKFDIGLRIFKAFGVSDHKLQVVTDLVRYPLLTRLQRVRGNSNPSRTSLRVPKGKEGYVYYDVLVSPLAVKTLREFAQAFPEILEYMRSNLKKWTKGGRTIPNLHKVPAPHSDHPHLLLPGRPRLRRQREALQDLPLDHEVRDLHPQPHLGLVSRTPR